MSKNIVIAIDGPSGTGKSTTAKLIAQNLGICYLDTGAMYRAITWKGLQADIPYTDTDKMAELTQQTEITFDDNNEIIIDGISRAYEIRTSEVSNNVSYYCAIPKVREILTDKQREIAQVSSSILDGRDIGTVVFPNADFKFFLVADYRVRAERRLAEMLEKGMKATLEEVEENLRTRDELDSSRETAPLLKAEGAIEIDTTKTTIQEQVDRILSYVSGNIA